MKGGGKEKGGNEVNGLIWTISMEDRRERVR